MRCDVSSRLFKIRERDLQSSLRGQKVPGSPSSSFPPAGRMTYLRSPHGKPAFSPSVQTAPHSAAAFSSLSRPPRSCHTTARLREVGPGRCHRLVSGLGHTHGPVASGSSETSGKAPDVPTTGLRLSEGAGRDSAAQQLQKALKDSVA